MSKALAEAKDLVEKMEKHLGENENQVKSFLEDHKHEVTTLAAPKWMQNNDQIPKDLFSQTEFRGQSLIGAMMNEESAGGEAKKVWQPEIHVVPVVGMMQGVKFSWPTKSQCIDMPLTKPIKLNGFGYKAVKELNELQLYFTSGVQSPVLIKPKKLDGIIRIDIDPTKTIGAIGLLQHPSHFSIYGLRFLDKERAVIVQEIWMREHPEEA